MLNILTPDPTFFQIPEFSLKGGLRKRKEKALSAGRLCRDGLSSRWRTQTRAGDSLGRVRPRLPARPRVTSRTRPTVPAALLAAAVSRRAVPDAEKELNLLDKGADRLLENLTRADAQLAIVAAQAEAVAGVETGAEYVGAFITEEARRLFAQTHQDLTAWSLRADDVMRGMIPPSGTERRRRGFSRLSPLPSTGAPLLPFRPEIALSVPAISTPIPFPPASPFAGGGASARMAPRLRGNRILPLPAGAAGKGGSGPAAYNALSGSAAAAHALAAESLRARLNALALRPGGPSPAVVAALGARVEALEETLRHAEQRTQEKAHLRRMNRMYPAPAPKPPTLTPPPPTDGQRGR